MQMGSSCSCHAFLCKLFLLPETRVINGLSFTNLESTSKDILESHLPRATMSWIEVQLLTHIPNL